MLTVDFKKFFNKQSLFLSICILCVNCLLYINTIKYVSFISVLKSLIIANAAIFVCIYYFVNFKYSSKNVLNTLGFYSLHIYVIHCFFTAGIRILMQKLDVLNIFVYFIASILLGIFIPIIIGKLCSKNVFLNFPFAPLNALKKLIY